MPRTPAKPTVFTIGHSTRSMDELVEVLRSQDISVLADIRTIRRSRTNPQFNEDAIGSALERAGIRYIALAALGGLRSRQKQSGPSPNNAWENASFRNYADYAATPPFQEGLRALMTLSAREPTAIMCAEAVWWRCHRRIVADHLLARGVPVVHLFTPTHSAPAALTPFAVVGKGCSVCYPSPAAPAAARAKRSQPKRD